MVVFNTGNDTTGCAARHFAQDCGRPTPWKDDPTVRQALDLATDKQSMINQLVGGLGKVMNSPFTPNLPLYYDRGLAPFVTNVQKANRMLEADGWKKGPDGVRAKNGRRLVFTLSTTSGNAQRAAEEELLGQDWSRVGASVTFVNHQAGEFFDSFDNNGTMATGQFDAGLFAEEWRPDPDSWSTFALINQIPGEANPVGQNWGRWRDQKLNDLLEQGASQIDIAKRQQTYDQAQQEWERYAGAIELYQRPEVSVSAPFVGNFAPGAPSPGLDPWNVADWFHKGAS
jgi:peptide/nickel transport system substrate-binding protein